MVRAAPGFVACRVGDPQGRFQIMRGGLAALALDLGEGDGGGDGGVERFDLGGHGDADAVVAGLGDEPGDAFAFVADDDEQGVFGDEEVVDVGLAGGAEGHGHEPGLLAGLDGAGEVDDLGDGQAGGGSGRGPPGDGGDGGGAAGGHEEAVAAERGGGADDGPEVAGVGDAVEGDQEGGGAAGAGVF